jgi:hypothetical protein
VLNVSDVKDGGSDLLMAYFLEVNDGKTRRNESRNGKDVQLIDTPKKPGR